MSVIFDRLAVDRLAIQFMNIKLDLAKEVAEDNGTDRFKVDARKKVFARIILPSPWLHKPYNEIYWDIHQYELPVEGYDELESLIKRVGWKQFLKCLEYYVARRGYALTTMTKRVTSMGVLAVIKKVKGLPKWLGTIR